MFCCNSGWHLQRQSDLLCQFDLEITQSLMMPASIVGEISGNKFSGPLSLILKSNKPLKKSLFRHSFGHWLITINIRIQLMFVILKLEAYFIYFHYDVLKLEELKRNIRRQCPFKLLDSELKLQNGGKIERIMYRAMEYVLILFPLVNLNAYSKNTIFLEPRL